MTVLFRHVRTGHLVARPEPGDEPVRRRADRARDIAKLDASPMWVRVTDDTAPIEGPVERGAAAESADPAAAPFQPAGHTVPEVLAYLADADEGERRRVLDAEAGGKARRGILAG